MALTSPPPFQLETRISARARRLRIEVRSADEVRLILPRRCSTAQAQAFLHQHRDWIDRQRLRLLQRPVKASATAGPWDGLTALPLHGNWLPVVYGVHAYKRPAFWVKDGHWQCRHHPDAPLDIAARTWLARRALMAEASTSAAAALRDASQETGLKPQGLRISDTRAQWGSCSASGVIQLCWRLVCAPPAVLRYVVIHELCHLKHRNHSPQFWALVARHCPNYLTHRKWLRNEGTELMTLLPLP